MPEIAIPPGAVVGSSEDPNTPMPNVGDQIHIVTAPAIPDIEGMIGVVAFTFPSTREVMTQVAYGPAEFREIAWSVTKWAVAETPRPGKVQTIDEHGPALPGASLDLRVGPCDEDGTPAVFIYEDGKYQLGFTKDDLNAGLHRGFYTRYPDGFVERLWREMTSTMRKVIECAEDGCAEPVDHAGEVCFDHEPDDPRDDEPEEGLVPSPYGGLPTRREVEDR